MVSEKEPKREKKPSCECHSFKSDDGEIEAVREKLLNWYSDNSRTLPWRSIAKDEADPNVRGYSVWVSEIMLQQTQVDTVIAYYNRWMKK
jgi:A/G-specific adenine glycosylase